MKPKVRANGMGTAFKRGRTWYAQVTIGHKAVERDGKIAYQSIRVTKGGFATKRDALLYCPTLKAEASKKKHVNYLTMRQIYDAWMPTHETKVSRSTMDCYKAAFKYFAPIHDYPFNEIDLDDLQECVDECPKGRRTKENMKALAGLLCKYAIPRHQTDLNYAEYIYTGNDGRTSYSPLNKGEIDKIRDAIGKVPHAEDIYTLIYTGFRPTELFNLTKDCYKDGVLYGGIKTEAGKNRAVPVSPRIKEIIENKLSQNWDLIFPKDDGSPMTARYFRDAIFYPVLAAIGIQPIPTKDSPPKYVPYSCRHTFANMIKLAEGSDKDKAGLMGHEDYTTTKRMYQTAEIDAMKAIIDQL